MPQKKKSDTNCRQKSGPWLSLYIPFFFSSHHHKLYTKSKRCWPAGRGSDCLSLHVQNGARATFERERGEKAFSQIYKRGVHPSTAPVPPLHTRWCSQKLVVGTWNHTAKGQFWDRDGRRFFFFSEETSGKKKVAERFASDVSRKDSEILVTRYLHSRHINYHDSKISVVQRHVQA